MRAIFLFTSLLFLSCATVPDTSTEISLPEPPFIMVYYDDEILGAVPIQEGVRTEVPFKSFVDSGAGDKFGIGVEIIAEDFTFADDHAEGRLEVTHRNIEHGIPSQKINDIEIPVWSERSMRTNIKLRSDLALHMFIDSEGRAITGYGLNRSDGWRFVFVTNEDTEPDDARNGGNAPEEERTP